MAMAAKTTIAEADKIVEVGEIDPEHVVVPGAFVDRIIEVPKDGYGTPEKGAKLIDMISQISSVRDLLFGKVDQK